MASTLESRTITVPSIVDYYTDEELNSEYHAKAEYEQAIEKYGAIYKILDLNNSGMSAQDMQEFVREWIRKHYFDGVLSFTVKGVDLHLLGYNKDKLSIGDRIPVEFLDVYKTPVTKVLTCISAQYDILNPGNSTYKIGIPDVSMDVKLPNKNRGSSVNKSSSSYSSSGSAGTSNLYKYYKELDTKAQIQAEEIEFLAQNISLHADNIDYITNGVEGVQQSAIIQNEGEVVNVVGSFDVKDNYYGDWPEWDSSTAYKKGARVSYNNGTMGYICLKDIPEGARIPLSNTEYWLKSTGRKAVIFKDGAQAVIDDVNGQQVSVGTKLGEHEGYITAFEGSALWTQRDNITGVCGEYDVVLDPVTGKKTLVIKAGGGIKIRKNNTEFGLYDEDNLTGGILVERVNTATWQKWTDNKTYYVGDKVLFNGKGYICDIQHHVNERDPFDPTKWHEYTATKVSGDVVEIEGKDHVSISVSDKINSQDTVIDGVSTKVETFEGSELWSDRNNIVNVCGEYEVHTDPSTGVKTLIIKSGGGLKIRRNNTEFGLYDEGSLTAGIMVDRINARNWTPWAEGTHYDVGDKVTINNTGYICNTAHDATKPIDMSKWTYSTSTKIKGDVVDIEARQIRAGDTTNVEAWLEDNEENIDDVSGLLADKITAYEARFHNIESDYLTSADITTDKLKAKISTMDIVTVQSLQFANGTTPYGQINFTNIRQAVRQYRVVQDGEYYKLQTKTLQASDWSDDPDSVPFKRATSVTVTGTWSGATYTVTGASNTLTTTLYNKIDPGDLTLNNVAYSKMYHDNPNIDTNQVGDTLTLTLGENVSSKYVDLYTGSDSTKIPKAKISTVATYNSGWNTARGYTVNNLPTSDIGNVIDSTYNKITIKYPNQNGDATLNNQDYTLNVNSNFAPQSGTRLVAAELKTNGNVVSRITVPMESKSITANGLYVPSSGNVGFKSVNVGVVPTLSGSWSTTQAGGTRFTVVSSPSARENPYYATVYAENGTATKNANWKTMVDIPISIKSNVYTDETPVNTGYSKTLNVNVSDLLENRTNATRIKSNGTYTAGSDYIGFGTIEIAVPTGHTGVKTKFNSGPNGYYIVATEGSGGSEIYDSYTYYTLGTSGTDANTKVQVQNTSGVRIVNTPELNVGSLYTDGQNAVGIKINADDKTVEVDTTQSTTKALAIGATATISYNAAEHTYTAYATSTAGGTEVSSDNKTGGTQAYTAGWTDCYGTVTGTQVTSGTADKTISLGYGGHAMIASQAKASSSAGMTNKYIIDVTAPSDNRQTGWDLARTKVSLPNTTPTKVTSALTVSASGVTYDTQESRTYTILNSSDNNKVQLTTENSGTKVIAEFTHNKYNAGWDDCYDGITERQVTSGTPDQTIPLGYGGEAMIAAQAKATPSASSVSNRYIIKVTAPSDNKSAATLTDSWTNNVHTIQNAYNADNKIVTTITSEYGYDSEHNQYYIHTKSKNSTDASSTIRISKALTLDTGSVVDGQRTITVKYDGTATGLHYNSTDYRDGRNAAVVSGPTWTTTGPTTGYTNSISVAKDGTVQNTQYTYMYVDSASKKVYIRYNSSSSSVQTTGTVFGSIDVSSIYTDGKNAVGVKVNTTNKTVEVDTTQSTTKALAIGAVASISYNAEDHTYTAYATSTAGGTEVSSDNRTSGTQAYNAGWVDSYGTVTARQVTSGVIDQTIPLGYGGEAMIAAQAKETSSASAVSNKYIINVTAPPDNKSAATLTDSWTNNVHTIQNAYNTDNKIVTTITSEYGYDSEHNQYYIHTKSKNSTDASPNIRISKALTLDPGSVVDGQRTLTVNYDGNATGLHYTTSDYLNGQNAVTLNDPEYNEVSQLVGSRTITVSTNGRPAQLHKDVTVVLDSDAWTNGTKLTKIKIGSAAGSTIAQSSITMPNVTISGSWMNGYFSASAKHGTYTAGTRDIVMPNVSVTNGSWTDGVYTANITHGSYQCGSVSVNMPNVTISGSWMNGYFSASAKHGTYTAGARDIAMPTVSITGSWANGVYSATAKHGSYTAGTASITMPNVTVASGSWSGNTYSADIKHGTYKCGEVSVDASERYTAGVNSVTVSDISIYGSPAATATSIPVIATASNGKTKNGSIGITTQRTNAYRQGSQDVGWSTSWSSGTPYTIGNHNKLTVATTGRVNSSGNADNYSGSWDIYVTSDNNVAYARLASTSGIIIAQTTHNKYTAGQNSIHLSKEWGTGNDSNKVIFSKTTSGSTDTYSLTVTADISYDSSTHEYTAKANCDGGTKDNKTGGTEAYEAGQSDAGLSLDITNHKITRALSSSTKEYTVEMYTGNQWNNGTRVIEARVGASILNSTTIYAPSVTLSFDCTDLGNPSRTDAGQNDNSITATAYNGTYSMGSGFQVIHMTEGAWNAGYKAVNCRLTNSDGKLLDRFWVAAPEPSPSTKDSRSGTFKGTFSRPAAGEYLTITCGGNTYSWLVQ